MCDFFDKLSWRDAGFGRRLLDLLAVLIDACQEENLFAFEPVITRDYIGQHLFVSVTDVRRRIRVIDRGGDEKRFRHLCGHTAQRTAVRQAHRFDCAPEDGFQPVMADRHLPVGLRTDGREAVVRDSQNGYLPSGRSTKRALSSKCRFVPSSYSGLPLIL